MVLMQPSEGRRCVRQFSTYMTSAMHTAQIGCEY